MKKYTNFFGIDVAKNEFVVALYGKKRTLTYANDVDGMIEREKHIF